MKVLLVNQYFHPDLAATAQIATDLGEDLAAAGMDVTAVASRGSYLGGAGLARRDSHRGVAIVRVTATSFGKRSLLHRALDYASFYLCSTGALLRLPRHDVILVMTTPPLIGAVAVLAKLLKRSKLVYWVQDLYPEVAVAFGALPRRGLVARAMAAVSRLLMRRADLVIALGDEMRRRCVLAGAVPERTTVVPNWCDGTAIRTIEHEANPLRAKIARGARIVVMYSGNMGRAHDISTLLEAARRLTDRPDIAFVFIGAGAKLGEVEAAARALPNVRLEPYQSRDKLAESLSAGDLHLVSLSPEIEGLVEPSKLYGVMAVGRPALFVGPPGAEVARTIERERCGAVVRNGDAVGLATAIRTLADDDLERGAMGERARRALGARYSRAIATSRIRDLLLEAIKA